MLKNKSSLRKQLLIWLLLPQLVLCVVGAAISYIAAVHYTDGLIDKNLEQNAVLLGALALKQNSASEDAFALQIPPALHASSTLYYSATLNNGKVLFSNQSFPAQSAPLPLKTHFYSAHIGGQSLRAATLLVPFGKHTLNIQVAKAHESRQTLYLGIFYNIIIPLALVILITSCLAYWSVKRGLLPLQRLRLQLDNRKGQDLSPIEIGDVPLELADIFTALNQLLHRVNESMNRQRSFIGDAAHQLRTPLAGLKSQTELAMRETSPDAQRARLSMVHNSATRSIHLVNQLLTLARSEPGNQASMLRIDMDLAKVIRELTAESVPRAIAAGIDLGCDITLSTAPIKGNSALLRELFVNLVENAIKYIPRGGCITVRLLDDQDRYIVEVEDDGEGIPDEDKARVFERFFRRQQDANGCGLGMAIVKEIAERHGGTVVLHDAQPHGLIVRVELSK